MTLNDKLLDAIFGSHTEVGYTDLLNAATKCRDVGGTHVVLLKTRDGCVRLEPVRLDGDQVFRYDGHAWRDSAIFGWPSKPKSIDLVGTADEVEAMGYAMLQES